MLGVLILLVAALVAIAIYMEFLGRNAFGNIDHATNLLLNERIVYSKLVDMETGVRGYTITGDSQFLQPYTDARSELTGIWSQIGDEIALMDAQNTRDRDELEALFDVTRKDADAWESGWAEKQIELRGSGQISNAMSATASSEGKRLFDQFRLSSQKFSDRLNERLREYSTDQNNIRETELLLLGGLGLVTLISGVLTFRTSRREDQLQNEITDQVEAERARLQAVIENLPVGVRLVATPGSQIILQNLLAEELFPPDIWNSLTRQERIEYFRLSKPDGTLLEPEDTPARRVVAEKKPVSEIEFTMSMPGGKFRHLLAGGAPIFDKSGEVGAVVVVLQDVTRMRELDQRKDEFIATAAHELRNPLAAMSGYNQLIQRLMSKGTINQATLERNLGEMGKQITRLNDLVERLLDASRIQLGRLILDKSQQDVVKIAEAVLADIKAADTGTHIITLNAPDKLKGCWDPVRIEQVITNLVSNALRHTPANSLIELKIVAQDDGVLVQVIDEGPGIPAEQRPLLFDRYYQTGLLQSGILGEPPDPDADGENAGAPRSPRKKQGLGLGLYISSEIVLAHKGRIGVDPNPEGGCIFWFTVPYGEC